jgi:hypothetical protein
MSGVSHRILTYNVQMFPPALCDLENTSRAKEMCQLLAPALASCMAVVLTEVFDDCAARVFISCLWKQGFAYSTAPLRGSLLAIRGGVLVLCRSRPDAQSHVVFQSCNGVDCLSNKGAVLVQLGGLTIVGTHLDSDKEDFGSRKQQVREIRLKLAQFMHRSRSTCAMVCGDLNSSSQELQELSVILGAKPAPLAAISPRFSYDPVNNDLAGRKRQLQNYGPAGSQQLLDGCLFVGLMEGSDRVLHLRREHAKRVVCRKYMGMVRCVFRTRDLSDHYPVLCEGRVQKIT